MSFSFIMSHLIKPAGFPPESFQTKFSLQKLDLQNCNLAVCEAKNLPLERFNVCCCCKFTGKEQNIHHFSLTSLPSVHLPFSNRSPMNPCWWTAGSWGWAASRRKQRGRVTKRRKGHLCRTPALPTLTTTPPVTRASPTSRPSARETGQWELRWLLSLV